LTGYHRNKRGIDEQIMKKFLIDQQMHAQTKAQVQCQSQNIHDINTEFLALLPHTDQETEYTWNTFFSFWKMKNNQMADHDSESTSNETRSPHFSASLFDHSYLTDCDYISIPSKSKGLDGIIDPVDRKSMELLYGQMYPGYCISFFPLYCKKFKWISFTGVRIGSKMMSKSSSVICAEWPTYAQTEELLDAINGCARNSLESLNVGIIDYFLVHKIHLKKDLESPAVTKKEHVWAHIAWKKPHEYTNWFGIDVIVSSCTDQLPSAASIMPAALIQSRCAYATLDVAFDIDSDTNGSTTNTSNEKVFVAVPLKFQIAA
jgi:hypothetical protein